MSDRASVVIDDVLRSWQDALNLTDWDIRYDPSLSPAKGSWAEVESRHPEKTAVIALDKTLEAKHLDEAIVHELLHVVLDPVDDLFLRIAAQIEDPKAQRVLIDLQDAEVERAIETIARAIVPHAPRLTVGEGPAWDVWQLWRR